MTALAMSTPQDLPSVPLWRRYWPIILLALLPLIPLFRAVFFGEAIGPFDQIRQMAPWNGAKPAQPWDVLQADGVLQFYVWRDLVFDAWGKGQSPFWNSFQLAGTPLLANSQSGAMYPPHILMGILHVPTAMAMTLLAWFHLFWAGLGTYLLCRSLGANKTGGFIAGASFTLSTFMIAWTGLPSVIETVSWIPFVLAFTFMIFDWMPTLVRVRAVSNADTVEEPRKLYSDSIRAIQRFNLVTIGLAVSVGMMILAGHLQFVAYGFFAFGILLIWLIATRPDPHILESSTVHIRKSGGTTVELEGAALRRHRFFSSPRLQSTCRVGFALILGVCIAAPQLLSVLQYSQFSHRKNAPTDTGYEAYIAASIQSYELVKLVVPTLQGNPRQIASDQLPVSTYYPAVLKPGANFAESAIGIGAFGVMLLCLLPLLAKFREPVWGLVAVGAVGFLLAMGTPINKLLYFGVPGWSSTGSPGRAISLFVLAACVGAGIAASRLDRLKEIFAKKGPTLGYALGGFVFVCVVCAFLKNSYELRTGLNPEVVDGLKGQAEAASLSSGIGITLIALGGIFLAIKEQSMRSKAVLLGIPILSSLAFFGTTLIQTGTPDLHVKTDLGFQRIAPINGSWDMFQAAHATMPPNLSALNRIHSLDGYDSLLHRDTVGLLKDIDGEDAAPPVNGNMMLIKPKADLKKLADAGVTEIWSQKPVPGLAEPRQEDNVLKYKLAGPGRASTPSGSATIESETASQIRLRAAGPGKLVVRERNMPGWVAKVDGAHVSIGGATWMEIELANGEHQVELNYVPPGFMTGIFMAIPAWILVLLLAFMVALLGRPYRNAS